VNVSTYLRPKSLDEALAALEQERAVLVGGGTKVVPAPRGAPIAVVDLQALGLDQVESLEGDTLRIGAAVTLQALADSELVPRVIREAARRDQPSTLRTLATVGGCVGAADFESELLAAMLAFGAQVTFANRDGSHTSPLADVLGTRGMLSRSVITALTIETDGAAFSARVGRTAADRPMVAAVARRKENGEVRVALSGVASAPVETTRTDVLEPPDDFRASSEYRLALATTLMARALGAV